MRATVIGAGSAGLAVAAAFKRKGIAVEVLDRADRIGAAWHGRYDRLHLHTPKSHSSLPGLPMPRDWPRYLPRDQVAEYLEGYARHFAIRPRLGVSVQRVLRGRSGWRIETDTGEEGADIVVCATGLSGRPHRPDWPGLGTFRGPVTHTADYRNPSSVAGQRVLVVGFGNSGGEIALELSEAGRQVHLAVRRPVNVLPRDIFGVPVYRLQLLQRLLGPRAADRVAAPLMRLVLGDLSRIGLARPEKGPATAVAEDQRIPLLDIGTLGRIRSGDIALRPGIARLDGPRVTFADGSTDEYDALVLATGFRPDLSAIFGGVPGALMPDGRPARSGAPGPVAGLYFCGYRATAMGQFRTNAAEARAIAADAASGVASVTLDRAVV
ncbi:flavin-containing monooxygenase [Roseitranquillus sediminis]|uniref:flavin-containing monooxygenase n=1 Tax=Roseitranquillus sediminis TaxID=2809051 RepID=UPI001D0CB4A4|nr:NAD(P)/FAD-dependent oxidoreductase [Roseitranquillus sediminis]MBM9596408.1 NAD(P)/FAD-dependent oxidoreductase [Roseitranquillus sediminis]